MSCSKTRRSIQGDISTLFQSNSQTWLFRSKLRPTYSFDFWVSLQAWQLLWNRVQNIALNTVSCFLTAHILSLKDVYFSSFGVRFSHTSQNCQWSLFTGNFPRKHATYHIYYHSFLYTNNHQSQSQFPMSYELSSKESHLNIEHVIHTERN
jgi:hypothetical protein